ncbi:hypothetical protein SS50377_20917 [Spironucleus salmonicida]|uniref:START domain-containing protein n=1 Tax=Spironucleus salmonicida TaxID=348837 RepID=V6LGA4_9EUKA|nr:hypothetical protein SS50377_20917 [Spironucleus salmonicida]|eukprot:EST43590.1 hypothetical protein SS50377_16632 [Spironucleus salmonicida]
MEKIKDLPQSVQDAFLAQEPAASIKCQKLISLDFETPKKYEEVVDIWYATVEGSKFQAMKGQAVVNADILTVLSEIHDLTECTPAMPAEQKDGKVCRYIYFPSDEVRANVQAIKDKSGVIEGNSYLCYQLIESPSAMISRREFYITKTTFDQSSGGVKKFVITQNNPEVDITTAAKAVRGSMSSCIVLEAEGAKTKVTTYFHVDPMGSIPAMIFTGSLNKQNNFLVKLLKKFQ